MGLFIVPLVLIYPFIWPFEKLAEVLTKLQITSVLISTDFLTGKAVEEKENTIWDFLLCRLY